MPEIIEFIKPDTGLIPLFQREPVVSVTKAEQIQDLLGQDVIQLTVESVERLELNIGGKIVVFGKQYSLNQLPTGDKKGERRFIYELTLEGSQYDLRKPVYFNTDVTGFNTSSDFPMTGDIEMFVDVLINNANRVFGAGTWLKGIVPSTGVKTIPFNENNCLAALQQFCKEFEQEFDIVQVGSTRILNIKNAGEVLGHIYEFGRGYGLYALKRQTVTDADIITRLYPYGANKNIPANYRNFSQRLKIPDPGYLEDAAAKAAFGIIEATRVYEDIYPRRTGTVSSVGGLLTFSDASMNFDLNETGSGGTKYLLSGTSAKIHFNTGNLAGYEFELTKYVHSTKTFTIIQYQDERGLLIPNADSIAFQMQVGDQYVILDINLPDSYVQTAEAKLRAQAQLWLDQNKAPRVQYSLEIDEMYLKTLHPEDSIVNVFSIGDYIQIKDDDLNIDKSSRVISLRRDILRPYKYSLTIDDTYQVSIIQNIIESQKEVRTIIKTGNLKDPNRLRMGWMTTQELLRKIFDTDGYFDGGKIKPESIETLALVVGAKSQQFILQNIVFQPNYEGLKNVVAVSSGYLVHYAIAETVKTWSIEETLVTIPDDQFRYIYAKVSKSNQDEGYMIFSTQQILPDQDPAYYHFLVGNLHTVIDGVRWISLTYGATAINGRFIKTGRIQSFDGQTYFDLDLGEIGGYIRFRDSNGNYRDLSDIGADTLSFYKATIINEPDSYINGKVTAWFQATAPDTWPSGENDLHEGDTWFKSNTGSVWRFTAGDWLPESEPPIIKSYTSTYARIGNNKAIQVFTAEPVAPYTDMDLWMSPEGLRRSIKDKVMGQPFDVNDWVEPFNFDNTETAINAGVLTSGIIQLAGDNHSVLAGISGKGTTDESVRFWAGASTINRDTAPFRVLQSGELFARKRIEVEGVDSSEPSGYKGQAGLAGSETEDKTGVRIYAGSNWEGKETAPFRVDGGGFMRATKGRIAGLTIEGQSLTNRNEDGTFVQDAQIIFRDDPKDVGLYLGTNVLPATAGSMSSLARYENNEIKDIEGPPGEPPIKIGTNIGAIFEASGARDNYAIQANIGATLIGEFLHNGDKTIEIDGVSGNAYYVDPTKYNLIIVKVNSPGVFITLVKEYGPPGSTYANPLQNGNEITILPVNNQHGVRLWRSLRPVNSSDLLMQGGEMVTVKYYNGAWYTKSRFDSDY
ncbi:hypothetical protein [Dyadobacter sp. LHD-138]|uniref:hypothetical protein n=1 Tax=Dyadobacter sp. LHD-138 TaxID=3071413 RepID=UPI0027E0B448|nr:hypothetical protein [Dyadobacter sp. LHD-138]MDQ6481601.1 hypothetical protein [Dyadobacter sp. LHD-138]